MTTIPKKDELYILMPKKQMNDYRNLSFFLSQTHQILYGCKVYFHHKPPTTIDHPDKNIFAITYIPPTCEHSFLEFAENNLSNPRSYVFTDNEQFMATVGQKISPKNIEHREFTPFSAMDAFRGMVEDFENSINKEAGYVEK